MPKSELLNIQWCCGYMTIVMSSFFPCTVKNFDKLLKLILMDNNQKEVFQQLANYLMTMVSDMKRAEATREQTKGFIKERQKCEKFIQKVEVLRVHGY